MFDCLRSTKIFDYPWFDVSEISDECELEGKTKADSISTERAIAGVQNTLAASKGSKCVARASSPCFKKIQD